MHASISTSILLPTIILYRYSSANNDQSRSNIPAFTHLPAAGRPTGRYTGKENTHPTPFQGTKNTYSQATHGSNQRLSYNITGRSSYKGPSGYTPHDTGHSSNWPENKGVHSQPSTHHVNTHSTNKSFSSMHMAPEVSVPGRAIEPTHHHVSNHPPSLPHFSVPSNNRVPNQSHPLLHMYLYKNLVFFHVYLLPLQRVLNTGASTRHIFPCFLKSLVQLHNVMYNNNYG